MRCHRSKRKQPSRGVAPLEITMVLPILVTLMAMFFLITSVVVTRNHTALSARSHAFVARYDASRAQKNLTSNVEREIKRVGEANTGPEMLIAVGEDERVVNPVLKIFQRERRVVELHTQVPIQPWDYEFIPFDKHPRLLLSEHAGPFGGAGGFGALGGITGGVGGGGALQAANGAANHAKPIAEDSREDIENEMDRLNHELSQLGDSEAAQSRRDEIRRRLAELQQQLDDYDDANFHG